MTLGALNTERRHLLEQLRAVILDDPDPGAGITAVRPHLADADGDSGWRTWLQLLLAETHQRAGDYREAARCLHDAVQTARQHDLTDQGIVAAGIGADIALGDSHPAALQACTQYRGDVARAQLPEPVEQTTQRFVVASVLFAVALYRRQSCQEGRRILATLLPPEPDSGSTAGPTSILAATGPLVAATIEAMGNGCKPGCLPLPTTALPPLPGGVLQPQLSALTVDFGARRIEEPCRGHRDVVHTCALAASSSGSVTR